MSTPNPATTPWVPLWNLNGAAGMNYRGAYAGATQYTDGDIVVYNGIAYMCVRPTQNPPAVWPMAPGTSAYGTSLPASPFDGQEAVLVDNVTNPSYQWRFRYNAQSTSAYKWEFIGGMTTPALASPAVSPSTNAWVAPGGTSSFTVPRAGDYWAEGKANLSNTSGANVGTYANAGITDGGTTRMLVNLAAGGAGIPQGSQVLTGLAAATAIKVFVFITGACTLDQTSLTVTPRRVS